LKSVWITSRRRLRIFFPNPPDEAEHNDSQDNPSSFYPHPPIIRKHMRFLGFIVLLFTAFSLPLFSQVRTLQFSDPDINDSNEIILKIENPTTDGIRTNTLVRGHADTHVLEALTVYPERSFYAPSRNELILYNHMGCYSYNVPNKIWTLNSFIPSFSKDLPISPLSLKPLEISPDGRFVLYVRESDDFAALILYDRDRASSFLITDRVEKEYVHTLAKWSSDSKYFIYRRGRDLFYFSIDQYLSERVPAESFRSIGFKDIQSIQWVDGNYLFVLKDRLIYRIHSSEFFTRSFYSDPFRRGGVWARIPVQYDPAFDKFSIDRKGDSIFFEKKGLDGMVFPLQNESSTDNNIQQTPIINSSETYEIEDSFWLKDGTLIVSLFNRDKGSSFLACYSQKTGSGFRMVASGNIDGLTVNADGSSFALFRPDSVDLYDSQTMTVEKSIDMSHVLQFFWGRNEYIALGQNRILTIDRTTGNKRVAGLSQIDKAGFSPGGKLLGFSGGQWYEYDEALSWIASENHEIRPSHFGTEKYRIFLEDLSNHWYNSTLKIRSVDGFDTRDFIPLYRQFDKPGMPALMRAESRTNPWYFDHGNRNENKEVSLVFNAADTAEGVRDILKILKNYQIQGTFFLNGDFIHANPAETSLIAESGNTVGSLFYTWFDMSDPRYQIDKTFLKKGLAQNEDDYFITTGREMDMLWHTPYYFINSEILEASRSMKYIYVGTDLNIRDRTEPGHSGDLLPEENALSLASDILEKVRAGSVIPFTLGKVKGQDEYLFQLLPMIIDELLRQGYNFVPLPDMIKNSR